MNNGINNTKKVKEIVGERINKARQTKGLTRIALAKAMCSSPKASIEASISRYELEDLEKKLEARIRQWESGANPVDIEWIPAICSVLRCDVGYLFGDYDERTRVYTDVVKATGLSKEAVEKLLRMPLFLKETLSGFICTGNFRNIVQGIFTYKQMMQDVVRLAEDPLVEYGDFQGRKVTADAMEFQTTKELGKVFTDIMESTFSGSDVIVKTDSGYMRVITHKGGKDG